MIKAKVFLRNQAQGLQCVCSRSLHDSEQVENIQSELHDENYAQISEAYLNFDSGSHRAFVLQPYVKWGDNKKRNTTPELQLQEAVALINTLQDWSVVDKMCVPLLTLQKNKLLGKGNFEKLKKIIQSNRNINTLFVSKNILRPVQVTELSDILGVPVFDRFGIVIKIFREHAKTPEAKLQVALAELPYMWTKLNWTAEDSGGRINLIETRRMLLQTRESKLKDALTKLKGHRQLLRKNRTSLGIPSVAVVGYTNAGKTSLIKALTGDEKMEPKNQLFATLDTTAHQGYLPCRLKVLYMDTIGFIQDVPESLLAPFVATFEDAMIAVSFAHASIHEHVHYW